MASELSVRETEAREGARIAVMNSSTVIDTRSEWQARADVAKSIHESGIYSKRYKNAMEIAIVMAHAEAIGLEPIPTLASAYAVHGKVELEGKALMAAILKSGLAKVIEFRETSAEKAVVYMERADGVCSFESVWDLARAKKTGNLEKHSSHVTEWLRWRAVAEAARLVFPEVTLGAYLPGECSDEDYTTTAVVTVEPKTSADFMAPGRIGKGGSEELRDKISRVASLSGVAETVLLEAAHERARELCGSDSLADLKPEHVTEVEGAVSASVDRSLADETTPPTEPAADPFEDE